MAYTPTEWQTGDVVTAEKLNKIEGALAGDSGTDNGMLLTVSQSGDDFVLDKNYKEIKTAVESGIIPFAIYPEDSGLNAITVLVDYGYADGKYGVDLAQLKGLGSFTFLADTDDGVLTLYNAG